MSRNTPPFRSESRFMLSPERAGREGQGPLRETKQSGTRRCDGGKRQGGTRHTGHTLGGIHRNEQARQSWPAAILQRLGAETESWIDKVRRFRRHFFDYAGPPEAMERCSLTLGRRWLRSVGASRKLWGGAPMVPPLSKSRRETTGTG